MKVSAERLENRRQQLLLAATKVFARKGYHQSRIADIAKEAGVAYGLVYHYFKNKEEILNSIFEDNWRIFLASIDWVRDNKETFRDRMEAIANVLFRSYEASPETVSVIVVEVIRSAKALDRPRLEIFQEMYDKVGNIIREGQDSGDVRADVDPNLAAGIFFGAIELVMTGIVMELITDEEDKVEWSKKQVLDLFMRGIQA